MGSHVSRILPQNPFMRADYIPFQILREAYLRVNCNLFKIDISRETDTEWWEEEAVVEKAV